MIEFVRGTVVTGGTEAVIALGAEQIGLALQVSARGARRLPPVGGEIMLWTHLAIRDDGWLLYGFPSREERTMFRLLITVAGIGPKVALNMLSAASPSEIAGCLRSGDELGLTRLPGIGRKSAARLVVELGQRIPEELAGVAVSPEGATPTEGGDELEKAVTVLTAMGLPPNRAQQALLSARSEDERASDDLESWVRAALQRL